MLPCPDEPACVRINNGSPGLTSLTVTVNGRSFKMSSLLSGEQRVLDVGSAMRPGDTNNFTLTGTGKPGASADVMISDTLL